MLDLKLHLKKKKKKLTSSSESLQPPLEDPLLLAAPCAWPEMFGAEPPLKNPGLPKPFPGGDGDREGDDAEGVGGAWEILAGAVIWASPGQNEGFQGA